jgi:hypothetical protein
MTVKFTMRDVFDTDVDTYWASLFFDREYNDRLYKEGLGFPSFEMLELTGEPGQRRTRKIRTEPKSEAPTVVKKLIGDSLAYTESGTWDPATRLWTFNVVTSKLADRLKITGKLWAEPKGDKKMERVCEMEIEVKILVGGGAIEKFVESTTRDNYVKAAKFTNSFIAEKKL